MDYNAGQTIIQLLSLLFKAIQNDSPANYTIVTLGYCFINKLIPYSLSIGFTSKKLNVF
jgi:hypothetical protein